MKKKTNNPHNGFDHNTGKPTYTYIATKPRYRFPELDDRILAPEEIESYLNYDDPGPPVHKGRLSGAKMVWLSTDRKGNRAPNYYYVDSHDRVPD